MAGTAWQGRDDRAREENGMQQPYDKGSADGTADIKTFFHRGFQKGVGAQDRGGADRREGMRAFSGTEAD